MKRRVLIFTWYYIFWYLLFVFSRIAFLVFQWTNTSQLSLTEILNTIRYGFLLDNSMTAYLCIFPGLVLATSSFTMSRIPFKIVNYYTLLVLILFSFIVVVDINLYSYWGFRLDATPLFYMSNLKAVSASVSMWLWIGGLLLIAGLVFGLYQLYHLLFRHQFLSPEKEWVSFPVLVILCVLLFIPIRGGLGISSLTISSAYFSQKQFANHAAINPMWNVAFSITESNDIEKRYLYFDKPTVLKLVHPLVRKKGNSISVLNTTRPNILVIIVESLTAKAVGVTGGIKGITPNIDSLSHQGILFDEVFATADRTDKGIAAVVAGYPTLPGSSPLKYQKLTEKLDFLPKELNKAGYQSTFYYGGTLDFANYRSFLVQAGYKKLVSDKDFVLTDQNTKWGAWDHQVFNRVLSETPTNESGFFKTILPLTSHEPFDIPIPPLLKGNDPQTLFLNSLHYTDKVIGDFIRIAKSRNWWKNTLVIIIADHGSKLPGNSGNDDFNRQHIPMIWTGGALSKRDTVIHSISSQADLASTLLGQLNINSDAFLFSKNILSTSPNPFAFYTFNDGYGFLTPGNFLIYNTVTNKFNSATTQKNSLEQQQSRAYLQFLYLDFFKPGQ